MTTPLEILFWTTFFSAITLALIVADAERKCSVSKRDKTERRK